MELSNENIERMIKAKEKYSKVYADFYMRYHNETKLVSYRTKAETLKSCFEYQLWDKYTMNLLLDNVAHMRCKDRFCINCQILNNCKIAYKVRPIIQDWMKEGLKPYMLTLTVPNCERKDLDKTLKKMSKIYNELFKKFNQENNRSLSNRLAKFHGAIRVLEVTYNKQTNTFHPHYHVLILIDDCRYDENLRLNLKPFIQGRYSFKKKSYNMHSNLSLQVAGVWTLLWKGISVTPKRVEELNDPKSKELLEVNITEFDGNYLELFKYVAKFDEITSYAVWKDLYVGLKGKRKYATSGCLYGVISQQDEEDVQDGEEQELILKIMEEPEVLFTPSLNDLIKGEKKEYKKVYRKNSKYDKDLYTQTVSNLDTNKL